MKRIPFFLILSGLLAAGCCKGVLVPGPVPAPSPTPTAVPTEVPSPTPCAGGTVTFTEGLEDDFLASRSVPDHVDPALSTAFSPINECRPAATGYNTLRDRDITACGAGGGFTPAGNVSVDLTDGNNGYVTFRYDLPSGTIGAGSTVSLTVSNFGSDGGHLFKSISEDGVNFTQVGDDSDALGTFTFSLPAGGNKVFLKVQAGNTAGIFEGIWVDDFSVSLNVDCP